MKKLINLIIGEFLGTAFLLMIVVGSGIMGLRLADGQEGLALLANVLAIGAGLVFLINTFGGLSGAHFNPVVTLADFFLGSRRLSEVGVMIPVQFVGAFAGVVLANLMFGLPAVNLSSKTRSGSDLLLAECVATFGLILAIFLTNRFKPEATATTVACYITAACWFTSSTSFANPAVTFARMFSDTFAGIHYLSVLPFIFVQFVAAAVAVLFIYQLLKDTKPDPS